MDSPIGRLRRWLTDESVVCECRGCGTSPDAGRRTCHVRGSENVARHESE